LAPVSVDLAGVDLTRVALAAAFVACVPLPWGAPLPSPAVSSAPPRKSSINFSALGRSVAGRSVNRSANRSAVCSAAGPSRFFCHVVSSSKAAACTSLTGCNKPWSAMTPAAGGSSFGERLPIFSSIPRTVIAECLTGEANTRSATATNAASSSDFVCSIFLIILVAKLATRAV
jgi:hypothetical protein